MSDKLKTFSHFSHGLGEHVTGRLGTNHKGDITRMAPKKVTEISVHDGMSSLQKSGMNTGGLGHPTNTIDSGGQTIATSAAAAPLADAYGFQATPNMKVGKDAPPVRGMRSRVNEDTESLPDKVQAGKDCLDEAVKSGGR